MKMRFFQALADIRTHYREIERNLANERFGKLYLESWNIDKDDPELVAALRREHAAITYLINCELGIARDTDSIKPDMQDLTNAFERHLAHIADTFNCRADNWRTCEHKSVRKEYEACRHYLFMLTLPAWVEQLPERIPTFENKYPDVAK